MVSLGCVGERPLAGSVEASPNTNTRPSWRHAPCSPRGYALTTDHGRRIRSLRFLESDSKRGTLPLAVLGAKHVVVDPSSGSMSDKDLSGLGGLGAGGIKEKGKAVESMCVGKTSGTTPSRRFLAAILLLLLALQSSSPAAYQHGPAVRASCLVSPCMAGSLLGGRLSTLR